MCVMGEKKGTSSLSSSGGSQPDPKNISKSKSILKVGKCVKVGFVTDSF